MAIDEIVADAITQFEPERLWPAHPFDDGLADGNASLYFGAIGVIWALDYLGRVGATTRSVDFRANVPHLLATNAAQFRQHESYAAHGSFLFGDMGAALVAMRLTPSRAIADQVLARAEANNDLPIRELMWGTPGSMLACVHMATLTEEPRWRALFETQASRLFDELKDSDLGPLWTQDLYGSRRRWLGPVHGYAGNMIPLIQGWQWLTKEQRTRVIYAVSRTLAATADRSAQGVNWHAVADAKGSPKMCQHCHGAAGMVTTFADMPIVSDEHDALMREGGELTWAAGPLVKGSNLCHGTGGNGYAFLRLFQRTRNVVWLDRARAFAMTAIAQARDTRTWLGRGRYSLWTGDVGLAIFLWDCITEEPRFPTIDVF